MKALLIAGSRNSEGQTARAAEAILQGVMKAGGEVERVWLPTLHLEHCHQCNPQGWGGCRQMGRCGGCDDDFAELVDRVQAADAVIFATPVYWGDLSESMRAFTDRLRRISTHEDGKKKLQDKIAVGVCVAGGGGGGSPTCCVSLDKVLRTCGFDVVDLLPVRRQNLPAKLAQLALVGEWLATLPRSA